MGSQIFQLSLTSLKQLQHDASSSTEGPGERAVLESFLGLAQACLGFDFVGTCSDESAEDLGTIQIPSSWRPLVEDPTTLQCFLDVYMSHPPPLSTTSLECLVRLSSVRRSIFSGDQERMRFIGHLAKGTLEILRSQKGLAHHENYHELCRLLGRLKTNFQLAEIISVEGYREWIERVAAVTVESLKSWQWASDSVFYLLGLWARLVSSVPYLKGDQPSGLDQFVPTITEAFITSRLEAVEAVLRGTLGADVDDPLEAEEQLQEQLEGIAAMIRFQYDTLGDYLCKVFDPLLVQVSDIATQQGPPGPQQPGGLAGGDRVAVLEGRLTWLVHLVGAVVRGRLNSTSGESQEPLDGVLSARVFALLRVMDQGYHTTRYGEESRQRLDIAVVQFFQSFRKVFVGEQAMTSSKVYRPLAERLGISDHLTAMNVMVTKLASNLKAYHNCGEKLVAQGLELFQDLSAGYMSGKLLLKLDSVQYILQNHSQDHFGFLRHAPNYKSRTVFYTTLGRLLFLEDAPRRFVQFVQPFQSILTAMQGQQPAAIRASIPREALVGLFRDLTGLCSAAATRRHFGFLFDWLYPHFPSLLACLEVRPPFPMPFWGSDRVSYDCVGGSPPDAGVR